MAKGRDLMSQIGDKLARRPHRLKFNLMVSADREPYIGAGRQRSTVTSVAWKHRRPQPIEKGWETP
jgi:hypothetical protein